MSGLILRAPRIADVADAREDEEPAAPDARVVTRLPLRRAL